MNQRPGDRLSGMPALALALLKARSRLRARSQLSDSIDWSARSVVRQREEQEAAERMQRRVRR